MCASPRGSLALAVALACPACGGGEAPALVRLALDLGEHRAALDGPCETDGLFSLVACPAFVELTVSGEGVALPPVRWPERGEELNEAGEAELALELTAGPARRFRCTAFVGRERGVEVFSEVRVEVVDLAPGADVDILVHLRREPTVELSGALAGEPPDAAAVVDVAASVLLARVEPRVLLGVDPTYAFAAVPTARPLLLRLEREGVETRAAGPSTFEPGEPASWDVR